MLLRCLLVLAILSVCIRCIYLLYIILLRNEIKIVAADIRPNNRKVSYGQKNTSVGTAKSRSRSSISAQHRSSSRNMISGGSYASYRSGNKIIK